MGSLGESENGWCYKVETSGKLITENLNLLPEFYLDPVETPGLFHVARLTHQSAQTAARLLQENHTNYHIFLLPEHSKGVSMTDLIEIRMYAYLACSLICIIILCVVLTHSVWGFCVNKQLGPS